MHCKVTEHTDDDDFDYYLPHRCAHMCTQIVCTLYIISWAHSAGGCVADVKRVLRAILIASRHYCGDVDLPIEHRTLRCVHAECAFWAAAVTKSLLHFE